MIQKSVLRSTPNVSLIYPVLSLYPVTKYWLLMSPKCLHFWIQLYILNFFLSFCLYFIYHGDLSISGYRVLSYFFFSLRKISNIKVEKIA